MSDTKPDLLVIKQEYFERVKPHVDRHDPFTDRGMIAIQQECKKVFDELAARNGLSFEQFQQILRGHRSEI